VDELAFLIILVCFTEGTIITVASLAAYLGNRSVKAALELQRKLAPVITVVGNMPDSQVAMAGAFLKRKFKEWADLEKKLEAQGL
jgi:hypothetical protein